MRTQAREGESAARKKTARTPRKNTVRKATPRMAPLLPPLLPHERDQSAQSSVQSSVNQQNAPRKVIKQAYLDVERGLEDTDLRGSGGVRQSRRASSTIPVKTAVKK